MTTPSFTINGLNPLALRIAMFLHGASGVVHMETIRAVAGEMGLSGLLPSALQQLKEYQQAEVCPYCDVLLTVACTDQWCSRHRGSGWKTGHVRECPSAGKMPAKETVLVVSRRHA